MTEYIQGVLDILDLLTNLTPVKNQNLMTGLIMPCR